MHRKKCVAVWLVGLLGLCCHGFVCMCVVMQWCSALTFMSKMLKSNDPFKTQQEYGEVEGLFVCCFDCSDLVLDRWTPDELSAACGYCGVEFTMLKRRHHCRCCGHVFCDDCSDHKVDSSTLFVAPKNDGSARKSSDRVCDSCFVIIRIWKMQ
jgi:FYVE zinc finger